MYQTIYTSHKIVVVLFLLIYLIKTILLLANKTEQLTKFSRLFKVPEMIISFLFLASGIYMLTQQPEINKLMIFKLIAVFASIPIAIIGFKRSNKALASLAMLLIIGAYGLAEVNKKQKNKSNDTTAVTSIDGKELYSAYCTKCHGEDGKAGLMGATDISLSQLDDTGIREMITTGKNNMQGFGSQLNPEQIASVSEYVKMLRK